eukprot:CAMPEP_0170172284 /NCGR_PEP_ID=MMETSP0040_2-20121228/5521_1 /TAXON_ID=641309 /ORGANISM="Lotharella oceanica, Strain CCMP622" /LENGTH=373 /DNA_ID=CAMNT_0010412865 /DNA_START=141 /DNA_END=1262 /DNA_ORIENTATION=-
MILEIWPHLPKNFALKQKDIDGDEITIGTQQDLALALEHCSKSLKLTIASSNESKVKSTPGDYTIIKTPPVTNPVKPSTRGEALKPNSELYCVWVGGLARDVGGVELKKLFEEKFKTVVSARVKTCPVSGRSRKYGFVELASRKERDRAINEMDGANWGSTFIRVRNASPKRTHSPNRSTTGGSRRPSPRRDDIRAMELHRRRSPVVGVPGEIAEVTWVIQNSGNKQWPVTHLTIGWTSLPPKKGDCEIVLPKLLPGKVAFATARFPVPKTVGEYEYKAGYQHIGPNGEKLGLQVTAWINTVDEKQRAEVDQTTSDLRREVAVLNAMGYKDSELIEHLLIHNNHDVNMCAKWLDANLGNTKAESKLPEADKRK